MLVLWMTLYPFVSAIKMLNSAFLSLLIDSHSSNKDKQLLCKTDIDDVNNR